MEMVGAEFLETVNYFKESWLPARKIVQAAIENRYKVVFLRESTAVRVQCTSGILFSYK